MSVEEFSGMIVVGFAVTVAVGSPLLCYPSCLPAEVAHDDAVQASITTTTLPDTADLLASIPDIIP